MKILRILAIFVIVAMTKVIAQSDSGEIKIPINKEIYLSLDFSARLKDESGATSCAIFYVQDSLCATIPATMGIEVEYIGRSFNNYRAYFRASLLGGIAATDYDGTFTYLAFVIGADGGDLKFRPFIGLRTPFLPFLANKPVNAYF